MNHSIRIKQKVEVARSMIIPLIKEGMFLDGTIDWEHTQYPADFDLVIRNQWIADESKEFYLELNGASQFFNESCMVVECNADDLAGFVEEFISNPHKFAEQYGD